MTWLGSCWEKFCSDGPGMFFEWDSLGITEFSTSPGSVVTVVYDRLPDRIVISSGGGARGSESDGVIRLPEEAGLYDFRITARWEEGTVLEGFRARIVER